ncbi:MAG: matrixin family metalloprotease [Acidobacteriota bacterium]
MTRRLRAGLAVVGLCCTLAAPTRAYVRATASATSGVPIAWDLSGTGTTLANVSHGTVMFRLQGAGSDDVTDGSDLAAVERAFETWSGISGSAIAFTRGPDTTNTTTVFDEELPVFWVETSTVIDQGTPSTFDDVDVAGALAITFTFRVTDGPEAGEIVDANLVFNGVDHQWTTDPATFPNRFDIEAVATHEIGHALGLGHSPVAAASMFPRTGAGVSRGRTLSADDIAGAIAAYPGGNSAANRGSLTGLLDKGSPVFGGLVWVRDGNGALAGHAMTQADGRFRIDGLPAGSYSLSAQAASDPAGFSLFSEANLGGIYVGLDRSFHGVTPVSVAVGRGVTTTQDLAALPGPAAMDILLIGRAGSFTNSGTFLRRGETAVAIGIAGPGLPATGTPLAVSGTGVSVTQTLFGTVASLPAVVVVVDVDPTAAPGPRDLVVTAGGEARAALGGVEILFPVVTGPPAEVLPLAAEQVGGALDLTWAPAAGATRYHVYSGLLPALRAGPFDPAPVAGGCLLSVRDASLFADPGDGLDHFYLVTGANGAGEGSFGVDASGLARPVPARACP